LIIRDYYTFLPSPREKAGETIPSTLAAPPTGRSDEENAEPTKSASNGFAALGGMDAGNAEEEEEDFGGLMVCHSFKLYIIKRYL
jgi:hypothetical protein